MSIFNNKFDLLDIENFCFILFIIASVIDINANERVRKIYYENENLNNDLRNQYLLASSLILIVFIIFFLRNLNKLEKLRSTEKEYHFAFSRFIGSILLVIGQALAVYYYWNTTIFSNHE